MLVCFGKPALEDELNDCMVQLPSTVCYDVCWWWDPELLHISISKAIRQLGEGDEICKTVGQLAHIPHTLGRYARWDAAGSDGLPASYLDMFPK